MVVYLSTLFCYVSRPPFYLSRVERFLHVGLALLNACCAARILYPVSITSSLEEAFSVRPKAYDLCMQLVILRHSVEMLCVVWDQAASSFLSTSHRFIVGLYLWYSFANKLGVGLLFAGMDSLASFLLFFCSNMFGFNQPLITRNNDGDRLVQSTISCFLFFFLNGKGYYYVYTLGQSHAINGIFRVLFVCLFGVEFLLTFLQPLERLFRFLIREVRFELFLDSLFFLFL
jgi:hypothetical protein